jgi:hypothetical protein
MNDVSASTEKSPSKTYVRDLPGGVSLEGHVSPCVFMDPGYPLQVQVTLKHSGKVLGVAYALNRTKEAHTYRDADVEALLAGIRLASCHRCAAPAFDTATVETNRSGLCESCFLGDLEAELTDAEEAEQREIAARDEEMKKAGMKFRVSAWIHPEEGGDDCFVDWYLAAQPTPEQVRGFLLERHSSVLDDYEIITL